MWRTGARLNLPLAWLPDRIAGGRFALEEPPSRPSEWVGEVLRQARIFAQRLEHMRSLDRDDIHLVSLRVLRSKRQSVRIFLAESWQAHAARVFAGTTTSSRPHTLNSMC